MAESQNLPAVISIPDARPNDGHEHFWSPRNIIAFALIAAFIFFSLAPYVFTIPAGRSGDLIVANMETLRNITLVVLAFYFGTTVNSQRDRETIRQQALAAPTAQPLVIDPPVTIIDPKDALDVKDADAGSGPGQSAGLPAPQGLRPRDDGPSE